MSGTFYSSIKRNARRGVDQARPCASERAAN